MSPAFSTLYVVLWVLVIFQGLVILGLFREVLTLKERTLGSSRGQLPTGTRAPIFTGFELTHETTFDSSTLLGTGNTVVLFVSPVCRVCRRLADGLGRSAEALPERVVAVSLGSTEESRSFMERFGGGVSIVVDDNGKIGDAFRVDGVPTAVALDAEGAVLGYDAPQRSNELTTWLAAFRRPTSRPEDTA